jgi:hypothetical protein
VGIKWHPKNKMANNPHYNKFIRVCEDNGDTFGATCISYLQMDETAVAMLNNLYDTYQFKTVISSSWNRLFSKDSIGYLFFINGLRLAIHEDWYTPRVSIAARRSAEIDEWLVDHPKTSNYAILDDLMSGPCLANRRDKDKLVLVNEEVGMTNQSFFKLSMIFAAK